MVTLLSRCDTPSPGRAGGIIQQDESSPVLPFETFAARVTVFDGDAAADLRARYIARFVDTTTPYYRQHIAHLTPHSDGWAYDGYLWDSLHAAQQIPEAAMYDAALLDQTVGVFWDLHSRDKIRTPNYWRFPKEAVLTLVYGDLLAGQDYLPIDLYVFDPPLSWSLVITHEWGSEDQRIYLRLP